MESVSQDPGTWTISSGVGLGWLSSTFDLVLAGTFSVPPAPAWALSSPGLAGPPSAVSFLPSPSPETYQKPPPTIRTIASRAAPTIIS